MDGSVIIPFNANFEVTLSGAAGSSSTGSQGGSGYTLKKVIRLSKGDTLRWETGSKGSLKIAGQISQGGGLSRLYVNDALVWTAGGGAGAVPAYNDTPKSIVWSNVWISGGEGVTNGASGSGRYHTHGGSSSQYGLCYTERHVIAAEIITTCSHGYHNDDAWATHGSHSYSYCQACGANCGTATFHGTGWGHTGAYHNCGGRTYYTRNCGYEQGSIYDYVAAKPGTCQFVTEWTPDTQTLDCTGNGKFSIKLCDHAGLQYLNTKVNLPYYLNDKCNLIILDDTVVYYKR